MLPLQSPRSHAPANPMNKVSAWCTPKRPNHPPRLYLSPDHGNPDSTPTEPALGDAMVRRSLPGEPVAGGDAPRLVQPFQHGPGRGQFGRGVQGVEEIVV